MTTPRGTARAISTVSSRATLEFPGYEDWMTGAPCATTDPELFWPDKGGSILEAKKVCMRCDVRRQCLRYALDNREDHGVWGGTSENERRAILRRRGSGVAA